MDKYCDPLTHYLCYFSVAVRIVAPEVLTVGQRATLTCSSDFSGDVISSIQWIFADNGSIAENMSVLTFNPTTDNLNGVNYTCRVTDTNNTVYMESVMLLVQGELLVLSVHV